MGLAPCREWEGGSLTKYKISVGAVTSITGSLISLSCQRRGRHDFPANVTSWFVYLKWRTDECLMFFDGLMNGVLTCLTSCDVLIHHPPPLRPIICPFRTSVGDLVTSRSQGSLAVFPVQQDARLVPAACCGQG